MSYLHCPDCRLTVPAMAYYLRGDECPRCMTTMVASLERLPPVVAASAHAGTVAPAPAPRVTAT